MKINYIKLRRYQVISNYQSFIPIGVWRLYNFKRLRGRPPIRWLIDLKEIANSMWMQRANNREQLRKFKMVYIQNWKNKKKRMNKKKRQRKHYQKYKNKLMKP